MKTKTAQYFLIASAALIFAGCSVTTKTTTENANVAWQNSSEMQTNAAPDASPTAGSQTLVAAPDALVKELYKTHEKKAGAIVQGENRQILDKYFSKNLANLIWKDMTTHKGEIGVIDFDIFYNTQDPDIKKLVVAEGKITGDKASVPVTFENYGTKNNLTYSLVKENNDWKIADINYGGADSLLKYFKEAQSGENQTSSAAGEFEGKYQVGDTNCTVMPAKMSFEVRWAKGSGVEMFFADTQDSDKITFSSSNPSGKGTPNVFSFDDENYNTGTFYRADGKEFPVKRIK